MPCGINTHPEVGLAVCRFLTPDEGWDTGPSFIRVSQQLHLSTTNEEPGSIELATRHSGGWEDVNPALYAEFARDDFT
jgi:hypothetical protein